GAVAGHRAEEAGDHSVRGHAEALDDGDRGGVALVDLRQYLGQAEGTEAVLQHGPGGLGGVPVTPCAGRQAVEDLQAGAPERPQPRRADEAGPGAELDKPDAEAARGEV